MAGLTDFIKKANEDGWFRPVINLIGTIIIAICSWMLGNSQDMQNVAILILFLILILMASNEIVYARTKKTIKAEALAEAEAKIADARKKDEITLKQTQFDLELASETIGFLVTRTQKLSRILSHILSTKDFSKLPLRLDQIDRPAIIATSLRGLCHSLVDAATILGYGTRASIMFRSTYMEVRGEGNQERLHYLGSADLVS
jgi:uncharacterized membrane protein